MTQLGYYLYDYNTICITYSTKQYNYLLNLYNTITYTTYNVIP